MKGESGSAAHRGLTLVEVLVSLAIMIVFVLPVIIGLSHALAITSQSSTSVAASGIARQIVEDMKATAYDSIQSSGTRTSYDLRPGDHYFQAETVVSEESDPNDPTNPMKRIKQAEVAVYQTGSATPLVVLFTYFTPAGV
ncbi:MAG: prepilin-type N-terminal cleavage/methylation domain-containing protein [Armatimonadota bacterium]